MEASAAAAAAGVARAPGGRAVTEAMRQKAQGRMLEILGKLAQLTKIDDPAGTAKVQEQKMFDKAGQDVEKYGQHLQRFMRYIAEKYRDFKVRRVKEKDNAVAEFVQASGGQFATVADVAEGIDDKSRMRQWLFSQMYIERIKTLKLFVPMSTSEAKEAKLIQDACDELVNFMKRGPGEGSMTVQSVKTRAQAVDRFEEELLRKFGSPTRTEFQIYHGPPLAVLENLLVRNNKEMLERVSKRAKVVTSDADWACLFRD